MIIQNIINILNIQLTFISINLLRSLIQKYPNQLIAIMIGNEASSLLHLILDGDPLPIEWKKLRKK